MRHSSSEIGEEIVAEKPPLVVALGASAGGLAALQQFFQSLPERCQALAFVVVQHLSPNHNSLMGNLLKRATPMQVVTAQDGQLLVANTVVLMPRGYYLSLHSGLLRLSVHEDVPHLPIDHFFRSMAEDVRERSVALVLSGTGSDGSKGLLVVKEVGGLVMVQEESGAEYAGMPRAAIDTGGADFVLSPAEMAFELGNYLDHLHLVVAQEGPSNLTTSELLETLKEKSNIDFSDYKKEILLRRVRRRMAVRQVPSLGHYRRMLEGDRQEAAILTRDILIGVTRFFRDPEAFRELDHQFITPLLEAQPGKPVRVWVAGCSTGEEVYSLVILFQEAAARLGQHLNLKVFATDLDREALRMAGLGVYKDNISEDVPADLLTRYFEARPGGFQIFSSVREVVVFSLHNVAQDPPFTGLDLISCRNLLIYFEGNLKKRVLSYFHFGLQARGCLFLGASESPLELQESFATCDANARIYQKLGLSASLYRWPARSIPAQGLTRPDPLKQLSRALDQGYRILLEEHCPPAILVDPSGQVVHVFVNADRYLKFPAGAVLLGLTDLLAPKLASVASAALFRAFREESPPDDVYPEVVVKQGAGQPPLGLRVRPLSNHQGNREFALVTFRNLEGQDVSDHLVTIPEIDAESQEHILALSQELQQVRINFQVTVEELETTNEELQATNEEFQSTSQEYQASAEQLRLELKASTQENYELTERYQLRVEGLESQVEKLKNYLECCQPAILFLDQELKILLATAGVRRYIPILEQDVGRPIQHFAATYPQGNFLAEGREVLASGRVFEHTLPTNTPGEYFRMRLAPYSQSGVAVTFSEPLNGLVGILSAIYDPASLLGDSGRILASNQNWLDQAWTKTDSLPELLRGWGAADLADSVERSLSLSQDCSPTEFWRQLDGQRCQMQLSVQRCAPDQHEYLVVLREKFAPVGT